MIRTTMLIAALLLAGTHLAAAQQSTTRSFYDRNGSFAGSAIEHGNSTSLYDRAGRFDGSVIRNSDGTRSYYDARGRFQGSSTSTTPPR